MSTADVVAVVLVGGRSARMGRDKATLVPEDGDPRPLGRRVLDALAPVTTRAVLAGTPRAAGLPPHVPVIPDRNPGAGPLAAIAGALGSLPAHELAVVAACDLPGIVPALVAHLVRRARENPDALCVLCATERGPEPLLSVWRAGAAAHLDAAVSSGVAALRDAIATMPHVVVAPEEWRALDPAGASFANWNRPEDLPRNRTMQPTMATTTLPRLGIMLPYTDLVPREEVVEFVQAADRLGYESVWVPEAYGYDGITMLTLLACRTERIQLATGIINVFSRTPALIGQTIAALDDISGGRAILGLGTSGPQVIEGWHGVAFERGVQRTREVVEIVRMVLRRERVVYQGEVFSLQKGLKLITDPRRDSIPVALATLTDAGVALTAELAERWMPTLYDPDKAPGIFADALARGAAKRDASLGRMEVCPAVSVVVSDDVAAGRSLLKPHLALYIGGMGSRQRNFYNALVSRYGYAEEARRIQDLYLGGDKPAATELVPDALVDAVAVVGDAATCRRRLADLIARGVDVPLLTFANLTAEERLAALDELAPARIAALAGSPA